MKNIVGDILQRPALGGATIALMDINPERLETSAVIANKLIATLGVPATVETYWQPAQGAGGCGFRRRLLPDRRLRACDGDRFRGAEEVWPAPHHRRYARRRRDHARPAGPCRISGRSARTSWRSARMPSCCNMSTRWRSIPGRSRRNSRPSARWGCAIRCRARRMSSPNDLDIPYERNPLSRRRHQPYGVLSRVRAPAGGWLLSRPLYPDLLSGLSRGQGAEARDGTRAAPTRCATRC